MLRFALVALMAFLFACAEKIAQSALGVTGTEEPGPAERFDAWKIIGPGGGGTMIAPTISPHDPNLVLEHCDMTGGYITRDGGLSWRMFNLRSVINTFALDPKKPDVIYAGNAALWRSEDTGKTWKMVYPDPAKNTRGYTQGDHADWGVKTDDASYPKSRGVIQAIAVNPLDSREILIAFGGNRTRVSILRSIDRGASWKTIYEIPAGPIFALHTTSQPNTIIAVSEAGAYLASGDKWEKHPPPPPGRIMCATIGTMRDGSTVIYVAGPTAWQADSVTGGVFVSVDYGKTWQARNNGLLDKLYNAGIGRPPAFRTIACSAEKGSTAYVGFAGLRLGEGPEDLFNGVARTTDGGASWAIVHKESYRPSLNLEGTWIEGRAPEGESIWFDAPYSLGVAPRNPDICYATDLFRTYRTLDGGRSWKEVNSRRVAGDRWTTRGLDVTTCYGVHFDPFDLRHTYITYTDIGMFQSGDAGASWTGSTEGIPRRWRNTTYWIDFDPKVKGLVWGAFSGTHDLPRPKMWRRVNPDSYRGGVGISTDGGLHWQVSNQGMPESAVTHILMDPSSPVGARVLYACAFGRGVFKSSDNGKNWQLKNTGIELRQPFAWRLSRADDGTLYLVVARRSDGGEIANERDGALYRSTDGADHWVKLALPEGTNGPNGLTIDPKDPLRLYLSAWGIEHEGGDTGGGIFLSEDGARSWRNILSESQHVYDVTVDPRQTDILYACGFDAAAYRSLDRGKSWVRIRGYNFKWGHRVIPDPGNPAKVYITTFGGSVWHGPAAGDPKAPEDLGAGPE